MVELIKLRFLQIIENWKVILEDEAIKLWEEDTHKVI